MKLPIPADWNGEDWRCLAIEWPCSEGWLAILRGFITLPQRGWTWDERTGTITEVQLIGREITSRNLPERDCLMACTDDVSDALLEIAQALRNQQNGGCGCGAMSGGSGGAGQFPPEGSDVTEGNEGTDPPPEGYETWQEFYNQKCAVARDIVSKMKRDMGEMALYNFGFMSVETLTIALTTLLTLSISTAGIVAIAALLLSVVATIVLTTAVSIISDNEEELICELFNGQTSADSRNAFIALFNSLVDDGVADPVQAFSIKALVSYMLETGETNRLYEKDNTRVFPASDCSCLECETIAWEFIEGGQEGWEAVTVLPECFGLDQPSLASTSVVDEKLVVVCAEDANSFTGAIRIQGIEFLASPGWQILVRLERLVSSSLYMDAVFVTDNDDCYWITITNDFTTGGFQDLFGSTELLNDQTIVEVNLYFSSHVDATGMTLNIEHIRLLCD